MTAKAFPLPELGELATLIDEGGVKIEALAVDHSPIKPAVGYRFTYKMGQVQRSPEPIKRCICFSPGKLSKRNGF